jgi:hypothetical protein
MVNFSKALIIQDVDIKGSYPPGPLSDTYSINIVFENILSADVEIINVSFANTSRSGIHILNTTTPLTLKGYGIASLNMTIKDPRLYRIEYDIIYHLENPDQTIKDDLRYLPRNYYVLILKYRIGHREYYCKI